MVTVDPAIAYVGNRRLPVTAGDGSGTFVCGKTGIYSLDTSLRGSARLAVAGLGLNGDKKRVRVGSIGVGGIVC